MVGSAALPLSMLIPSVASAAERRLMSDFGTDHHALQSALDWAHGTRGQLVLDTDVTVRGTVLMGSVSLLDGGGRIQIIADSSFEYRDGSGQWRKRAAILMRSARDCTLYPDTLATTYDVEIGPNVRIEFVRTDSRAPEGPILFTGLSFRSRIEMSFTGRSTGKLTCNGPDYYFFNRAMIAGDYRLDLETRAAEGGFWFRDIDELEMGREFRSDLLLARPVFSKVGGADECVSLYTIRRAPGHLRVRGSLDITQSNGLGFSILNNSGAADSDFDIALMELRVRSTTKPNQPVLKIRDSAPQIDRIEATFAGSEIPGEKAYVLRCIRKSSTGKVPQLGSVKLVNQAGNTDALVALNGECVFDTLETVGL